jgi:hypothetical protein
MEGLAGFARAALRDRHTREEFFAEWKTTNPGALLDRLRA